VEEHVRYGLPDEPPPEQSGNQAENQKKITAEQEVQKKNGRVDDNQVFDGPGYAELKSPKS